MSTPNFNKQSLFDLYATNDSFLVYPYKLDDNDDYILDESGEYVIDYDTEPYFDHSLFQECKKYTDNNINNNLTFFRISFDDGHYSGIQTIIEPNYDEFDPFDWLKYPQYYDNSVLFKEFGYNTYILKLKILKEIKFINNKLLPKLAKMYNFDKLHIVAQFSNGETIYERAN